MGLATRLREGIKKRDLFHRAISCQPSRLLLLAICVESFARNGPSPTPSATGRPPALCGVWRRYCAAARQLFAGISRLPLSALSREVLYGGVYAPENGAAPENSAAIWITRESLTATQFLDYA